jgi:hypothetical protein
MKPTERFGYGISLVEIILRAMKSEWIVAKREFKKDNGKHSYRTGGVDFNPSSSNAP